MYLLKGWLFIDSCQVLKVTGFVLEALRKIWILGLLFERVDLDGLCISLGPNKVGLDLKLDLNFYWLYPKKKLFG
jgi:hypothetical protein